MYLTVYKITKLSHVIKLAEVGLKQYNFAVDNEDPHVDTALESLKAFLRNMKDDEES